MRGRRQRAATWIRSRTNGVTARCRARLPACIWRGAASRVDRHPRVGSRREPSRARRHRGSAARSSFLRDRRAPARTLCVGIDHDDGAHGARFEAAGGNCAKEPDDVVFAEHHERSFPGSVCSARADASRRARSSANVAERFEDEREVRIQVRHSAEEHRLELVESTILVDDDADEERQVVQRIRYDLGALASSAPAAARISTRPRYGTSRHAAFSASESSVRSLRCVECETRKAHVSRAAHRLWRRSTRSVERRGPAAAGSAKPPRRTAGVSRRRRRALGGPA